MKKLIICEGRRDNKFIKELLNRINITKEVQFFIQEESYPTETKKREESVCLRRFFEDSSPYKVLVKSESGRDIVIGVFSFFMSFLFEKVVKFSLQKIFIIVDLDGQSFDAFVSEIKEVISKNRVGGKLDIKYNSLKQDNYLKTSEISVVTEEDEKLGEFLLTTFNLSLEREAGIDRDIDNSNIKDTKVIKLLENKDIVNHFSYVLNM